MASAAPATKSSKFAKGAPVKWTGRNGDTNTGTLVSPNFVIADNGSRWLEVKVGSGKEATTVKKRESQLSAG